MSKQILIQNIYYMLAYVYDDAKPNDMIKQKSEAFTHTSQLYAALLSTLFSTQVKQGLMRDYVENIEELSNIKGKFNFNETLKANTLINKRMVCAYDEYSEDNLHNQILKSTFLNMMLDKDVLKSTKQMIKKHLAYLSNVSEVNLQFVKFNTIQKVRGYHKYHYMLQICYLYQHDLLINPDDDGISNTNILENMQIHALFEKFVMKYYKVHYPKLYPKSIIIRWNDIEDNLYFPVMRTDINLQYNDHVLIIDTKYYTDILKARHDTKKFISSHLFQLFSYISNYANKHKLKTSGMLLYAQTSHEESIDISETTNNFNIHIKSIDLNQDFESISHTLNTIANMLKDM